MPASTESIVQQTHDTHKPNYNKAKICIINATLLTNIIKDFRQINTYLRNSKLVREMFEANKVIMLETGELSHATSWPKMDKIL